MTTHRALLYAATLAATLLVAFFGYLEINGLKLGFNISESLPKRFYIFRPVKQGTYTPQRYDKIVFRLAVDVPKEYGYKKGYRFAKVVAGIPGDAITQKISPNGIVSTFINGQCVARAYKVDGMNNVLPQFIFNGEIPKDCYFVLTQHPYSFDSRYFGFVGKSEIIAVIN